MTNTYDICIVCIIIFCCQILSAGLPSDILTCELIIASSGRLKLASIYRIPFYVIHYSAYILLKNGLITVYPERSTCNLHYFIGVYFFWGGGVGPQKGGWSHDI